MYFSDEGGLSFNFRHNSPTSPPGQRETQAIRITKKRSRTLTLHFCNAVERETRKFSSKNRNGFLKGKRASHAGHGTEQKRKILSIRCFKQLSPWHASWRSRREFAFASAMIWGLLPHIHRCRCIRSRVPDSSVAVLRAESLCHHPDSACW